MQLLKMKEVKMLSKETFRNAAAAKCQYTQRLQECREGGDCFAGLSNVYQAHAVVRAEQKEGE